jgi:hypothetical protein
MTICCANCNETSHTITSRDFHDWVAVSSSRRAVLNTVTCGGCTVYVIFQIIFSLIMTEINIEVQNLLPWDIVAMPVNLYSVQQTVLPLWSVIRWLCIDRPCLCGSRISIIAPQVRRSILWVVWDNVLMFCHTASIETVLFESILTHD